MRAELAIRELHAQRARSDGPAIDVEKSEAQVALAAGQSPASNAHKREVTVMIMEIGRVTEQTRDLSGPNRFDNQYGMFKKL